MRYAVLELGCLIIEWFPAAVDAATYCDMRNRHTCKRLSSGKPVYTVRAYPLP